jgi:hypothetical protein
MEARDQATWCDQCQAPELWPANVASVNLYLAADTQWRYAGMDGARTGLDYAGVRALMSLRAIPATDRPALFADLQTLEEAQLRIDYERRQREQAKKPALVR